MIIGIDIRVLGSPIKSGIEEYTENLLAHMIPLDPSIKYKLFFSSLSNRLEDYNWLLLRNVEVHKFKIPNKALFFLSSFLNLPQADKLMGGVDVFFSPHFFLTSLSPQCSRVTTFHDLSYIHFPEFFSWQKNLWHQFQMKPLWQSRFSNKIIAVSESTKKDLTKIYDIDPAKIKVIYSGISPDIKKPSQDSLEKFKKENNLPDKFILFLGKLEPRKNVAGIIKAFNQIKMKTDFGDLHLVIVGSRGWLYDEILKEAENSRHKNQIIFKNHINDKDRPFYYSLASVFVYPSFFEGFGFPPLEAMKCQTPVIVSNNSSFPEVIGRGGLFVNPYNISDLVNSIDHILRNNSLREVVIKEGLRESSKFDWNKTAQITLEELISSAYKY